MSLDNLKIASRIGAGFGIVLVLTAALLAAGISSLNDIGDIHRQVVRKDRVNVDAVATIDAAANATARSTMELFMATDKDQDTRIRGRLDADKKVVDAARAKLEMSTRDEAAAVATFKTALEKYMASASKVADLLAQGSRDDAAKGWHGEAAPALESLRAQVKQLFDLQAAQLDASATQVDQGVGSARNRMLALGLAALLAGIGLAVWLVRAIVRPLNEAIYIAETVTSGDLSQEFETERGGEFGRLLRGLGEMEDTLTDLVGRIKDSSDSIMVASKQIAAGNQDLSLRTEEQASSLQETASTVEELTSAVKKNAESARRANELVLSTSGLAAKGGNDVEQLVGTMDSINASSRKIVDIIGAIDSIAFQTNILALNAAVEAARAGEQGRGFAVVAGEVRTLAQRAAGAAKEIKTLIGDSVETIEEGSRRAAETGRTMDEIVAGVKRVTEIMADISAATREQTSEIEQINRAIAQIDQATQQNAALVEEAAAAAASLQEQAGGLVRVVGTFKLDEDEPNPGAQVVPIAGNTRALAMGRPRVEQAHAKIRLGA